MSLVLAAVAACETTAPSAAVNPTKPERTIVAPPVADSVMGGLSQLARHILIGLRDTTVRRTIFDALRAGNGTALVDLTNCEGTGVAGQLIRAGEFHGGAPASAICNAITARGGVTLYMSPERLTRWNPRVIPIVSALEHPELPYEQRLKGYVTADQLVDLSSTHYVGPVLVVLPYRTPQRIVTMHRRLPQTLTIARPNPQPTQ